MRRLAFALICLTGLAVDAAEDPFVRQSIPRKWIEPVLPEDLPAIEHPSYADALDKARAEAFRGRYRKSLHTLLTAKDADPIEAALIKAISHHAIGEHDAALAALSDGAVVADPGAQVQKAAILQETGRATEAVSLLRQLLQRHPDSIAGRFQIGQAFEQLGDLDSARNAYGWFIVDPQNFLEKWQTEQERGFDSAADVTIIARAIDRWALLTGSYHDLPQLHDTLMDMFVRAYDVIDRAYWPAHVASAEYFLSHDNATQAQIELKAALAANPNDIHAHILLGKIALEQWNFDFVDARIASIRKVNPQSVAADLLEARNLLQQRRPADAATALSRVLSRQPDHIEALGLQAATHALRLQEDQMKRALDHVEKLDPDNATAYFEVAEQLGAMRQYPRAIAMYKTAIERAPWWTAARNGLGLLYTQSGDEDDAKATLDAAHAVDPYNLKTTNYLRLLDDLRGFARRETEHFVVMYDAQADPIIPEYFAEYLESIHEQVCARYQIEPDVKTYIEVFPKHDQFSVRTTGSPWIGTVGASTGRVIAMVTPRKGEMTLGPFNWAAVLKHEYTHTVTLAATDNRIPHWMTEGLAVVEENSPLKWEWVPMLYDATIKNELFTIRDLTWAFIRPKKPSDRSMAYAQSFWVCTFIEKTWGHDAILKLMAEFKNGASEQAAFEKVLGKSLSQFETEFFAWAAQQVAGWGYDEATTEQYTSLREKGEALIKARKYPQAVEVWQQILAIRPVDPLPHQRLAGLYLTKDVNDTEKAIVHLKALDSVELHDNRYAKRIARLYRDAGKLQDAQSSAMQAVYINPYDLDAHNLLLEIATKADDQPRMERQKQVIPVLEAWLESNRPKPMGN